MSVVLNHLGGSNLLQQEMNIPSSQVLAVKYIDGFSVLP